MGLYEYKQSSRKRRELGSRKQQKENFRSEAWAKEIKMQAERDPSTVLGLTDYIDY